MPPQSGRLERPQLVFVIENILPELDEQPKNDPANMVSDPAKTPQTAATFTLG